MAKPQWKRVLVTLPSGDKAYRYTDGKGNYRLSHPDSSESMASRRGLSSSQGGPSIGEQLRIMAGPAGGETKTARVKGKPTAGESKPAPPAAKPKPKPSGMANIPPKEANAPVNVQARKPKPAPAASTTSKPKPKPAAPAAAKPKPKAPSKPVAKPSETYKDGGKGLYQGSKEYRDKVGGSGNPLLNRFRRDMGRDAKTGERQYSTPEDKSKYVDKNGKLKIQDKPKPQPTAAKSNPKPPTSKTGGNTPITASKPMEGGTPFNTRNRFETPEQRKKRLAREGRA